MSTLRFLTATLLTLTTFSGLSAQSCSASFAFAQNNATAAFQAEFVVPEGYTLIATEWDFGDGSFGTLDQPYHTYPFYGTFSCCLTMHCANAAGEMCSYEVCEEIVLVQPQPCELSVNFLTEVGVDGNVTFIPTVESGNHTALTDVTWDLDGTERGDEEAFTYAFSDPGVYPVCLTVEASSTGNTCGDIVCKDLVIEPFQCDFKPFLAVDVLNCALEASVEMEVVGQTEISNLAWTLDGAPVGDQATLTAAMGDAEGAELCLVVEATSPGNSCQSEVCQWVENACDEGNTTHIHGHNASTISIYPNPTQGLFNVEGANGSVVRVYNTRGALVLTAQAPVVDAGHLPAGMYVVEIANSAVRQQLAIR